MSFRQALALGLDRLRVAGVPDPMRDARLLLEHAAGLPRGRLTLYMQDELPVAALAAYQRVLQQRQTRVPMSHILGGREFYGRWFKVTADVLDPRPETEILVGEALAKPFVRVLDLGTGSGAILLSLLAERPAATGIGADLSAAALAIARENAKTLQVADRCSLLRSDWFAAVSGRFDLIVSNPPYIAQAEMADLSPEVRREPEIALTDFADGLTAYRCIASGAPGHLQPGGWLMVEIGWQQGADVAEIFDQAGLQGINIVADLDGRDRVVIGRSSR